jgi:hypothetical protein
VSISSSLHFHLNDLQQTIQQQQQQQQPGKKNSYLQKCAKYMLSLVETGGKIDRDEVIDTIIDINKELLNIEQATSVSASDSGDVDALPQGNETESEVVLNKSPVTITRKRKRLTEVQIEALEESRHSLCTKLSSIASVILWMYSMKLLSGFSLTIFVIDSLSYHRPRPRQ